MVEWSITTVLKTVVPRGTGGSNPSLSASEKANESLQNFVLETFFVVLSKSLLFKIRSIKKRSVATLQDFHLRFRLQGPLRQAD